MEFCAAMNKVVGNICMKSASHLVTYQCDPLKTQVDYRLVRRDQRKFVKGLEVLPREDCITQHKPLIGDLKMEVKDTVSKFVPARTILKLHEDRVKSDFNSYISKYEESGQENASVKGYWNILKGLPQIGILDEQKPPPPPPP